MHRALAGPELLKSILSFLPSRDLATSIPAVSKRWLAASRAIRKQRAAIVLHAVLVFKEYRLKPRKSDGVLLKDVILDEAVSRAAGMCAEAAGLNLTGMSDAGWEDAVTIAKAEAEAIGQPNSTLRRTFKLFPVTLHHADVQLVEGRAPLHLFAPSPSAGPLERKANINDIDLALEALVVLHAESTPSDDPSALPYRLVIRYVRWAQLDREPYQGSVRDGYFGKDFVALFRTEDEGSAFEDPETPSDDSDEDAMERWNLALWNSFIPLKPKKERAERLWFKGLHITDAWLANGFIRTASTVYSRRKWLALVEQGRKRGMDFSTPRQGYRALYFVKKHLFVDDSEKASLLRALKVIDPSYEAGIFLAYMRYDANYIYA
ncbi:hypothetical protein HDU96_008165 [Phlyctochytrium bullatum]|nr:hypothetical protein HDU96_008165 [Phlyctochytrium bullatum]